MVDFLNLFALAFALALGFQLGREEVRSVAPPGSRVHCFEVEFEESPIASKCRIEFEERPTPDRAKRMNIRVLRWDIAKVPPFLFSSCLGRRDSEHPSRLVPGVKIE
ncbi:hypothetical protein B0H11DRAFT_1899964 [Mycena galericulata]|nr:hypothetical protein B0H11DRAFT_1899964 [Mycena galericulata]